MLNWFIGGKKEGKVLSEKPNIFLLITHVQSEIINRLNYV